MELSGSFGSMWVGDNVPRRILGTLNFWVQEIKKFKLGGVKSSGHTCTDCSVSWGVFDCTANNRKFAVGVGWCASNRTGTSETDRKFPLQTVEAHF